MYRVVKRGTIETVPRVMLKPARPENLVRSVEEAVDNRRGKATIQGPACEFTIDRTTMRCILHEDLDLHTFKRIPRQALTPVNCTKRLGRAKILLNKMKKKPARTVNVFSDKTPFSLSEIMASDSGWYLAEAVGAADNDVAHFFKKQHFASLQVLAIVASDRGKCPLSSSGTTRG